MVQLQDNLTGHMATYLSHVGEETTVADLQKVASSKCYPSGLGWAIPPDSVQHLPMIQEFSLFFFNFNFLGNHLLIIISNTKFILKLTCIWTN